VHTSARSARKLLRKVLKSIVHPNNGVAMVVPEAAIYTFWEINENLQSAVLKKNRSEFGSK